MKSCCTYGILVLLLLSVFDSFSQNSVIYSGKGVKDVETKIWILKDEDNKLSPEEAADSDNFHENISNVPNLGISNATHWVKFKILNESDVSRLLLEIPYPILDQIELYSIDSQRVQLIESLGEIYRFDERTFSHQNYIFNLAINPGYSQQYLLKIKSGEQILLPMKVGSYQAIYESHITLDLISGIYFGIILVMFLYNLFIYFTVRDRSYLFYVIYIILVGLTQATLKGYSFKYLWPGSPWFAQHSVTIIGALVGIATIFFVKDFLATKKFAPKLDKGLNILVGLDLIAIALSVSGLVNYSYSLIDITAGLGALLIFIIAIKTYKKGLRSAKFFLPAWSIFLVSVLIFVMKDYGIVPYNIYTRYALEIGSAIEVILLSFALADRINILKREKEQSQAQALEVLRENERIIKEQNIILEQKVHERTTELQESNKDLNTALKNLQEAQTHLVNAEKMASLGQLTAGIAHEINNPINFVASNVKPLKLDINDLKMLLDKYSEIKINNGLEEKLVEIEKLKKELNVSYLLSEIDELLNGIEEGAQRTSEIIRGLKNFSRLDEDDLKIANLNEGLDSTLTLLRSKTKGNIEIIRNYEHELEVECFPGKLNQVFMNIITNAIDALHDYKPLNGQGEIKITTRNLGDNVMVSIADNGPGIRGEIKDKIFDPFFTTKDVGEGTGLGLSIVYSIIESHRGDLKVESEEGKGTNFIITLPKEFSKKTLDTLL